MIGPLSVSLQTGYLFRSLGTQLESGVPLLESLDVARDACRNSRFKGLVNEVIRSVTQGEELSAAFRRSHFLNPAVKQMIATGEQTGNLAPTFIALADHLDKTNEKQIKRLSAVFEPLLLLLMGAMIGFIAVATLFPLFKLTAAVHG
jgi:type II secretory pathway component PulF